jgi:site-specific DNA-cytosine methylase
LPQGAGYDVSWEVINARCLTAQTRKRLFLVGIRRQLSALSEATGHSTTANAGQRREVSPFAFPYIPDLGLRAADLLQHEDEISASHHDTAGGPAGLSVARYTISDEQMSQLLNDIPSWKPSKLAWPDSVCATLTSHYAVSIGRGTSHSVTLLLSVRALHDGALPAVQRLGGEMH